MRAIALILTVLTGFSGLVYQVTWQKYLAVLLGSHSEATAAVLGIFLGGLSSGYLRSPVKLSSGLFRIREPFAYSYEAPDRIFELKRRDLGEDFVKFYRDDPIASIAVQEGAGGSLAIVTNGKSDGNIPLDDETQELLALLPALTARGGSRAFVIGYATGMTVGALGGLDENLLRTLSGWFDPEPASAEQPPSEQWRRYFHHAAPFALDAGTTATSTGAGTPHASLTQREP